MCFVQNMETKLFDCFKDLEDPRRLTHILHPARNIIYIAFAANFNAACKIAVALLIHDGYDHGKKKLSIRRKMNKAILNQKYLEHLLSML